MAASYLRLVSSARTETNVYESCLDVFQGELDYVFRTLRRLGTPPSEVEDLAHEVFLALRRCWADFDHTRPVRPYLFGIAFRIAAAHHRKRRREVGLAMVEVGDLSPSPDDVLQSKQARTLVVRALEKIPLPRRAVLVMHDIDDVPVRDVARALSLPMFTVYSRLRKGRGELATIIRRMVREGKGR